MYTEGVARDGYATVLNVDPEHPLSEFGWENLEHIADYCEETGIRLVLFTAPLPAPISAIPRGISPMWMRCASLHRSMAHNTGIFPCTGIPRQWTWAAGISLTLII